MMTIDVQTCVHIGVGVGVRIGVCIGVRIGVCIGVPIGDSAAFGAGGLGVVACAHVCCSQFVAHVFSSELVHAALVGAAQEL